MRWSNVAALLTLGIIVGCDPTIPYVELRLTDPDGVASEGVSLAVGRALDDLQPHEVESLALPATITVTSFSGPGRIWVEVRDGSDNTLARGSADVEFVQEGQNVYDVALGRPCVDDDENDPCDDGVFCNGVERCDDARCQRGDVPCSTSPFSCVEVTCVEELGECSVEVAHNVCEPEQGDGGVLEPTYCDVAEGCLPGAPCYEDADCDDAVFCNGEERCLGGRCVGGTPPPIDDENACTQDGCLVETSTIFHLPLEDGAPCVFDRDSGEVGVCLATTCALTACGDGYVDTENGELCDDGNANDLDGCRSDCQPTRWVIEPVLGGTHCEPGSLSGVAHGWISDIATAPDGAIVWSDRVNHKIRRYDSVADVVTTVLGAGPEAHAIEGLPALESPYFVETASIDVNPVTGEVYALEQDGVDTVIIRVGADDGLVHRFAGTAGNVGLDLIPGPADYVDLVSSQRIAFAPDGALFIIDRGDNYIHRVPTTGEDAGMLEIVGGLGSGTAFPALGNDLIMNGLDDLAFKPDGSFVLLHGTESGAGQNGITHWVPQGDGTYLVDRIAGDGTCGPTAVDVDALTTPFCQFTDIEAGVFGDEVCVIKGGSDQNVLLCIDETGFTRLRAGNGNEGTPATGALPLETPFGWPTTMTRTDDGGLYLTGSGIQYGSRYLSFIPNDLTAVTHFGGGEGQNMERCGIDGDALFAHVEEVDDVEILPDGTVYSLGYWGEAYRIADDGTVSAVNAVGADTMAVSPGGQMVGHYPTELYLRPSLEGDGAYIAGEGLSLDDGAVGEDVRFDGIADLVWLDEDTIVVAEADGHRLREMRRMGEVWAAYVLAGTGLPELGGTDGLARSTGLYRPQALALDAVGRLWVGEGHGRLRVLDDGAFETVRFFDAAIRGLAFDPNGNLLVSLEDHRIVLVPADDDREIRRDADIVLVAGDGQPTLRFGPTSDASLYRPSRIAVVDDGTIYAVQRAARRLVRIRPVLD